MDYSGLTTAELDGVILEIQAELRQLHDQVAQLEYELRWAHRALEKRLARPAGA